MSFRPPASLLFPSAKDMMSPLEIELAGEKADALARAGRKLEEALLRLEAARDGDGALRDPLIDSAADAVFGLTIQRELCGLRNQTDMVRRYQIPKEVMARVGITRKSQD